MVKVTSKPKKATPPPPPAPSGKAAPKSGKS
jgi:hypothetical protein